MANPFSQYDPEENKAYRKMLISCVAAASMVLLLFLVVLFLNAKDDRKISNHKDNNTNEENDELDEYIGSSNLTSEDLDFWDMYDEPEDDIVPEEEGELTPFKNARDVAKENSDASENTTDKDSMNKEPEKDAGSTDKKYDDDKHIAITDKDGKKVWYEILADVDKHDYDFNNKLINENNKIKYKDGDKESVAGIDLSKHNGNVDFSKLKEAGIDFVMLRIAARGYGSGIINLDEKFVEYATAAKSNGIDIGVYFYSQAINKDEAIEEACYAVGAVANFGVKYPIAIDVETVEGDASRTDNLTVNERSEYVKAFCDTVKQYGYNPIIYANKSMLVAGLDLKMLDEYDVWLADTSVPTDYPYDFSMWQYNNTGAIDGIEGNVDLNISFIDYSEK